MARVSVDAFQQAVSNTLQSINADADRSVNFMAKPSGPGHAKSNPTTGTTPGLRPWVVLPDSPIRSLFQQDGRAWAVGGGTYFELFTDATYTSRGSVAQDDFLASQCSNGSAGNQNLITSGGSGYVYDLLTNTLGSALGGDFPSDVAMCIFIDGYGVVFTRNSRHFQISAPEDFTMWDALDFGERSIASDNIVSMLLLNRNIWFLGSKTSEPWYNCGDPLFPFLPMANTLIIHGTSAAFGAVVLADTIFSLGQDETGNAMVWRYDGYVPNRISTPAVEFAIANTGASPHNDFSLAVMWTYQEQGQSFILLQCPGADRTWVYDLSTGLWHERLRCNPDFDTTVKSPTNSHIYFAGKHLVGDPNSGAIYEQSLEFFEESIVT